MRLEGARASVWVDKTLRKNIKLPLGRLVSKLEACSVLQLAPYLNKSITSH